eukprot:m.188781 g.188781  ORF g.188781 m.188781 type:complete len:589 (-) comp15090_c0_seq1:4244-6010(-)
MRPVSRGQFRETGSMLSVQCPTDDKLPTSQRRHSRPCAAIEWYHLQARTRRVVDVVRPASSQLALLMRSCSLQRPPALSVTGMSGSTHENTVAEAFSALGNLQSVRSTPRGEPYAITLTFDSVATATQVLTSARAANDGRGMVVDGRELSVDFARVTGSSQLAGPATGAAAAAIQAAMAMSAAAKMQGGAYGASAPVAAGAAAAPVAQVVPAAGMLAGVPEGLVYDATSGYYYDKTTGYYYDSSTGYYYDGKTGAYFWWDPTNKAYMPISGPTTATAEATATETPPESSQSQEKDAKKVAADMERWAKKRKREEEKAKKIKLSLKRPAEQLTNPDASASAPEETTPSTGGWVFEPESASDATAQHLEAQSASDADTEEVQLPEDAILLARYSKVGTDPWELAQGRGHVDISQGTCLLCQRGLGSEEKLEKHVRGSKLHATNLTEARDSIIAALSAAQKDAFERAVREASYRDRAAERRTTFGQSKKAPKRRAIAAASRADEAAKPIVQPNRKGIADNNLGSKMLRQMGWTKGQGLGKAGQGITAPIVAQKHVSGAGIGAAPVIGADEVVADTYKGQAALKARARYNQQ